MTLPQSILATATASEEIPDFWQFFALGSFLLGAALSLVLLVSSFVHRHRSSWFNPATVIAMLAGAFALTFSAYVYKIDYVAVEFDGTKASPPIWQALSIPSLPLLVSLTALTIYRRRITPS